MRLPSAAARHIQAPAPAPVPRPTFEELYSAHVEYLWRNARRLGVSDDAVDDVLQQVFLVVHRRLPEIDIVGSGKTWLLGVLIRVVRDYKRLLRRKSPHHFGERTDPEGLIDERVRQPDESVARGEAATLVQRWLGELPEARRIVFVLAEFEQLTAVEIGAATNTNARTVCSRLRAARRQFEEVAANYRREEFGYEEEAPTAARPDAQPPENSAALGAMSGLPVEGDRRVRGFGDPRYPGGPGGLG